MSTTALDSGTGFSTKTPCEILSFTILTDLTCVQTKNSPVNLKKKKKCKGMHCWGNVVSGIGDNRIQSWKLNLNNRYEFKGFS